jgi:predicted  nucleic acid-binding Zn-ribbon protein
MFSLFLTYYSTALPSLLSFNIDRIQRKTQQTEIETLKAAVENQKAALEARDNDIAKLKHEVAETRKEMTDGISLIRRRANTQDQQKLLKSSSSTALLPKRSSSESTHRISSPIKENGKSEEEPFLIINQEEFSEHAWAITHAKFSSQGDLIASCDMDNIVR